MSCLFPIPDELSLEILNFLTPEDLLRVTGVCQDARRLITDTLFKPRIQQYLETCSLPLPRIEYYCQLFFLNYDQIFKVRNPYNMCHCQWDGDELNTF